MIFGVNTFGLLAYAQHRDLPPAHITWTVICPSKDNIVLMGIFGVAWDILEDSVDNHAIIDPEVNAWGEQNSSDNLWLGAEKAVDVIKVILPSGNATNVIANPVDNWGAISQAPAESVKLSKIDGYWVDQDSDDSKWSGLGSGDRSVKQCEG